jgi:hypothetical protein
MINASLAASRCIGSKCNSCACIYVQRPFRLIGKGLDPRWCCSWLIVFLIIAINHSVPQRHTFWEIIVAVMHQLFDRLHEVQNKFQWSTIASFLLLLFEKYRTSCLATTRWADHHSKSQSFLCRRDNQTRQTATITLTVVASLINMYTDYEKGKLISTIILAIVVVPWLCGISYSIQYPFQFVYIFFYTIFISIPTRIPCVNLNLLVSSLIILFNCLYGNSVGN